MFYWASSLTCQQPCKVLRTNQSDCARKEFNSHRIGLVHQHGHHFTILGHQYGWRDVMCEHYQSRSQCPLCTSKTLGTTSRLTCTICTLKTSEYCLKWRTVLFLFLLQHGTRHIIESMNKAGHFIDTLFLCGGLTKNELFIQTHADVTGLCFSSALLVVWKGLHFGWVFCSLGLFFMESRILQFGVQKICNGLLPFSHWFPKYFNMSRW